MLIIAGLGNPGKEYENTRHNAGFMVMDALAEKIGADISEKKHKALCGKGVIGGGEGHSHEAADLYEFQRGEHPRSGRLL